MLWYKGWLETRFRLIFGLGVAGFALFWVHSLGLKAPEGVKVLTINVAVSVAAFSSLLGGAGIATQRSAFQAARGLHGSTLFTLSMPVSRFRLLATRACLGWLEMSAGIGAVCIAMWVMFPALRRAAGVDEMIQYTVTLVACATGLHSLTVLLATCLDDVWRTYASLLAYMALWWLPNHVPWPASAEIFRAMADRSPLIAHTVPWSVILFSLILASGLCFAALQVVHAREY
jgi:hypothetical protein